MRKNVLPVVLFVLLSGCRMNGFKENKPTSFESRPFTAAGKIEWGTGTFDAEIVAQESGDIALTLTSSDLQTPVTIRSAQGAVSFSMGEQGLTLPEEDAPAMNLASVVSRSFVGIALAEGQTSDSTVVFRRGAYSLATDAQTGAYQKLEFPGGEILFSRFGFTDEKEEQITS